MAVRMTIAVDEDVKALILHYAGSERRQGAFLGELVREYHARQTAPTLEALDARLKRLEELVSQWQSKVIDLS